MQKYQLDFQENQLPREYVYELSTLYLLSSSLRFAQKLKLVPNASLQDLQQAYPQYEGLQPLLRYLSSFGIIDFKDNFIHPTELSDLTVISESGELNEKEWNASFDILEYLNARQMVEYFTNPNVQVLVEKNSLRYTYTSAKAMLLELAQLHILSSAIHFLTEKDFFTILIKQENPIPLQTFTSQLAEKNPSIEWKTQSRGLAQILQILDRYQLVKFDQAENTIKPTQYSYCLAQGYPQTLYPAMLCVDENWWRSAVHLEKSFERNSPSAFVYCHHKEFYEACNPVIFGNGMSSLSLLEDQDVAKITVEYAKKYDFLIDIGGGKGGLLAEQYLQLKNHNKKYILFEKEDNDGFTNETIKRTTLDDLAKNYDETLKVEIVLGDFFKHETIPKHDNAIYFIKCVVHNLNKEKAVEILTNLRKSMGQNCQLVIAERVVPKNFARPHLNKMGNILMRLFFKADAYDTVFYETVLAEAGFNLGEVHPANNFMVFVANEKPELQFKKSQVAQETANLPFWKVYDKEDGTTLYDTTHARAQSNTGEQGPKY